jgi:hypothetical protein
MHISVEELIFIDMQTVLGVQVVHSFFIAACAQSIKTLVFNAYRCLRKADKICNCTI